MKPEDGWVRIDDNTDMYEAGAGFKGSIELLKTVEEAAAPDLGTIEVSAAAMARFRFRSCFHASCFRRSQ